MKKYLSILTLLAVVATLAVGCNKKEEAPAETAAPAQPEAPSTNAPAQ